MIAAAIPFLTDTGASHLSGTKQLPFEGWNGEWKTTDTTDMTDVGSFGFTAIPRSLQAPGSLQLLLPR